jgi:beta-galactosidase
MKLCFLEEKYMKKIDFNGDWTVCHFGTGESAKKVNLPHDAMLSEPRRADSAGGTNTGWYEGHDYCYKKQFFVPEDWKDKKICFEFEGVYHNAEVLLNGEKAAFRPYGYTNFYVDANKYLHFGEENQIRVIARNADQPNSRWYSGAGIYRPVWLYLFPEKHILPNGIKISTLDWKKGEIQLEVKTSAAGEIQIRILEKDHIVEEQNALTDGTVLLKMTVPDAKAWSPYAPNLYTCRVTFGEDVQEVSFGIRTISCEAKHGFCINGKRVILRGACIHHDNGILGAVMHPFAEARKVRLLKENGYNAIRMAHNPCSKAMLDACDRLGMLMMDEYADMWYIHKTQYDYASYLGDWWKQDLKDMVDKDYNHPSVIMYSIGNEVSETAQPRGIKFCEQMCDYLHELDSRPVTCGINIFFNFLSSLGFGVYSDKKAGKAAKQTNKKKKAVGSEFFNNLAGLMGAGFMKFGATLHGSDVKTRDAFAKLDVAGYNYGINRYRKDLKKYPNRVIVGSETFCSDAYRFWELAKGNPALIGDFVWTGMDYLGEVGVGAWEYKDYAPEFDHGPGWFTAGAGRLDLTGKPSGEAAYTQVAFELSPIRIGVVPAVHAFDKHSPSAWKMTNTFESWSWNGCEGKETKVEVYARGEKISLFLNGELLESKKPKGDCRVTFCVAYQPGELQAVAYDENGRERCHTSLFSAGEETRLLLEAEQEEVKPTDLCYVRIKYTDKNGVIKPLERGNITVHAQGGTLLGLGSACPYQENSYLSNVTDTYYGEALAIIQPGDGDRICVEASDGTYESEITISIV